MSDEPLAASSLMPTSRHSETEYEAICAAFMETMRGRWFLGEYARRNRNSDTKLVLAAIERIEAAMQAGNATPSLQRLRAELAQMQRAIASTKLDLAAIESDLQYQTGNGTPASARTAATSDIFAVVGRLQAAASTLRERGVQRPLSEQLDQCAAEILAACSSHNITEHRTRQVMQVLHYLEGRINAMVDIWGGLEPPAEPEETKQIERRQVSRNELGDHAEDATAESPRTNGSSDAAELRGDESGETHFSHVAIAHELVDPEPAPDNGDRPSNVFVLDAEAVREPAAAPLTGTDVPAEPASVGDARSSPAEAATEPIETATEPEPPDAFASLPEPSPPPAPEPAMEPGESRAEPVPAVSAVAAPHEGPASAPTSETDNVATGSMLEHLKIALASASELVQAREAQAEAEQLLAAGPADALPSDPAANEPKDAADAVNPPASVAEPIRPQCLDEPVIAAEPQATEGEQQSEPSVAETDLDAPSFEPPGEPTTSTSEPAPSPAFVDAAIEPAASSAAPNGQDPSGDAPQMNKGAALPDVDLADYDPGAPTAPTSEPVRKESNQPACVTDDGKSPPPGEQELADFLFEPAAAAGPEPALEPAAPQQAAAAALSKAAQEIAAPEPIWDQSLELAPPMPSIAQTNPTPPAGPVPASASHAAPLPARANPADPLAPLLALSDEEKIALFS